MSACRLCIVVTMLCCVLAVAVSATADVAVSTNTTAERFSTLTQEEKLSYLDAVMDTNGFAHPRGWCLD
jgi:hypothetical protein